MEQQANANPYAFGTLWTEITNGITAITNGITGMYSENKKTERFWFTENTNRQKDRLDSIERLQNDTSAYFTGTIIVVILFVLMFSMMYMYKTKK